MLIDRILEMGKWPVAQGFDGDWVPGSMGKVWGANPPWKAANADLVSLLSGDDIMNPPV